MSRGSCLFGNLCFGAKVQTPTPVQQKCPFSGSVAAAGAAVVADENAGEWAGGQDATAASEGAASSMRGGAFDEAGPGHATDMAAIVSAAEGSHALGGLEHAAHAPPAAANAQACAAAYQRSETTPERVLGSAKRHAAGCAGPPSPQARPGPAAALTCQCHSPCSMCVCFTAVQYLYSSSALAVHSLPSN